MSTILKRLRFFLLSTIPSGMWFHRITAFLDVYRMAIQQHSYLVEERESCKSSKFLLCNGSGPSPHEITVVREKPGSDWFRPYSWTHQQQRWGNCHDYQVPLLDLRSNLGLERQTWGSLWKAWVPTLIFCILGHVIQLYWTCWISSSATWVRS